MFGLKNSRYSINQSDAKGKPITTWSLSFYRASVLLFRGLMGSLWYLPLFLLVVVESYFRDQSTFSMLNESEDEDALIYK